MIKKRIEICFGTDRDKFLRARLSLLVMEGDNVLSEQYHSINIAPGADLAALRAANEAHLADPKGGVPGAPWPKIPDSEWSDLERHVAITHKPEIVIAFKAKREAAEALAKEKENQTT